MILLKITKVVTPVVCVSCAADVAATGAATMRTFHPGGSCR